MNRCLFLLPLLALSACGDGMATLRTASGPCEAAPLVNAETASAPGILPAGPEPMANRGRRGAVVEGAALNRALLVTEVAAARLPGGTAEVSVTVESCSFDAVDILAEVSFLDAAGNAIEVQNSEAERIPPGSRGLGLRWRSRSSPAAFRIGIAEAPRR
ncbi:hypothetical protein ACI6QG_07560 [Roseococcus sp. DSY-14]|uniref:hypothetical protein n=1 Tax=Roseococcus sp. DSY-14 TaxID=3369650 RepID=UPI00387AFFE7